MSKNTMTTTFTFGHLFWSYRQLVRVVCSSGYTFLANLFLVNPWFWLHSFNWQLPFCELSAICLSLVNLENLIYSAGKFGAKFGTFSHHQFYWTCLFAPSSSAWCL